ncbi:hypothetical protein A8F94_05255 [Bacillus sp. FJAT-27225]|uniref:hypothetical protein n=1 Tax=Bacillus sp. FJAT-27225 TaxID=1743144 RepID=UPI00080C2A32|nr:hypothetical protein [Bacillus sp. FJAT-27225]OCA91269.1 hypothetical protein A8F94_05255 [Bacillus sp. FJAT-27225]
MNSRVQINKVDDINNATDLAEMGVTYTTKLLNSNISKIANDARIELIKEAPTKFGTNVGPSLLGIINYYNSLLENNIKEFFNNDAFTNKVLVDSSGSNFIVSSFNATITDTTNMVTFNSLGDNNKEQKKVSASIPLQRSPESTISTPSIPAGSEMVIKNGNGNNGSDTLNPTCKEGIDNKAPVICNEVNVTGQLLMQGNRQLVILDHTNLGGALDMGGTTDLFIGGDATIGQLKLNGNVSIFVFGDLLLKKKIESNDLNGNSLDICVLGNSYYLENGIKKPYDDLGGRNKCSSFSGSTDWSINLASGVTVDYLQ